MRRALITAICLVLLAFAGFICAGISRYVWLPDVFTRQPTELAALDHDGVHFKIIQFWGDDFYRTRLVQTGTNGAATIHELDADDRKHWKCGIKIQNAEHKLVITFPSDSRYWEYWWDSKRLIRHQQDGTVQLYPPS